MTADKLCQVLEVLAPAIRRSILIHLSGGECSSNALASDLRLDSACLDEHLQALHSCGLLKAVGGHGANSFGLASRVQIRREAARAQIHISLGHGEEMTISVHLEGS